MSLKAILECLETQKENSEVDTAKLCLIENALTGPCSEDAVLDKEAQTLTIPKDVVANYSAGQSIDLQNANGESCGEATVAAGEGAAVYNAETGVTTIKIVECELDEGKTPAVITQAQPVKAIVKAAIKTVKAFAVRKLAVKQVKETTTRG